MTELEAELFKLLKDERETTRQLILLLLDKEGSLESPTKIIVPENTQGRGNLPWNLRKAMLERKNSKKYREIEELQEEEAEELKDAG